MVVSVNSRLESDKEEEKGREDSVRHVFRAEGFGVRGGWLQRWRWMTGGFGVQVVGVRV